MLFRSPQNPKTPQLIVIKYLCQTMVDYNAKAEKGMIVEEATKDGLLMGQLRKLINIIVSAG